MRNNSSDAGVSTVIGIALLVGLLIIMTGSLMFFVFNIYDIDEEAEAQVDITQADSDLSMVVEQAPQADRLSIYRGDSDTPSNVIQDPERGESINLGSGMEEVTIIAEYQGEERVIEYYEPIQPSYDYIDILAERENVLANKDQDVNFNLELRNHGSSSVHSLTLTLEIENEKGNIVYDEVDTLGQIEPLENINHQLTWPGDEIDDDGMYTAIFSLDTESNDDTVNINVDTASDFYLLNISEEDNKENNWEYNTSESTVIYYDDNFTFLEQEDHIIENYFEITNVGDEPGDKPVSIYIEDENNNIEADEIDGFENENFSTDYHGSEEVIEAVEINEDNITLEPGEEYNSENSISSWSTPPLEDEEHFNKGTYTVYVTTQDDTKLHEVQVKDPPYYEIQNMSNYNETFFVPEEEDDPFTIETTINNNGGVSGIDGSIKLYTRNIEAGETQLTEEDEQELTIEPDENKTVNLEADIERDIDGVEHEIEIRTPNNKENFTLEAYPPSDFQITEITPEPEYMAIHEENIEYNVTVENEGGPDEGVVELDAGDINYKETSFLMPFEDSELTFDIGHTGQIDSGNYDITVSTKDDEETQILKVRDPPYFEVTDINSPDDVLIDEEATIEYTIQNTGDLTGTQTIESEFGDEYQETHPNTTLHADLDENEETTFTFTESWSSRDMNKQISITTENETETETIEIHEPADYEIEITDIPDTVETGDSLSVDYSINNHGDRSESAAVDLRINGNTEDSDWIFSETSGTLTYDSVSSDDGDSISVEVDVDGHGSDTETVSVDIDSAYFSITSTDISVFDDTSFFTYEITNTGEESDTQEVTGRVVANGDGFEIEEDEENVSLNPGETYDNTVTASDDNLSSVEARAETEDEAQEEDWSD